MQRLVAPGGLFVAEYMMPIRPSDVAEERYLRAGELRRMFDEEWSVQEDWRTGPYDEGPHVDNPVRHRHEMGYFAALRTASGDGDRRT
jgi:hypothetical protein